MPFCVHFCHSCVLPAETSILSTVPSRSSFAAMKSLLYRRFLKKHSTTVRHHSNQMHHQQILMSKFQRIKGSHIAREINTSDKSHPISKSLSNYDMTILHEDELNNTQLATIRRQKKKIPSWATKDQLQLAIINQVYFQKQNPEDIFGRICIDHIFDVINSIDIDNGIPTSMVVSRYFI